MTEQRGITGYALFIILLSAIGGVLYGYEIGIINAALLFIENDIPMTPTQISSTVAAVFAGGMIATLIAGPIADRFGRRSMMIFSALFFGAGVVTLATAQEYIMLILGRLIQGMGIGFVSIVIPLYLAEIMPAHLRGRGVGVFQLLLTSGIVMASFAGYYFAPTEDWRSIVWTAGIPAIIFLMCLTIIPESPRWLIIKNQKEKAIAILKRVHGTNSIDAEFELMKNLEVKQFGNFRAFGYLLKREYMTPMLVVFSIAALQQFIGINAFLQYNALILESAGAASQTSAAFGGVWISGINFTITIVALFLVDYIGRKPLLTIGLSGVTLALAFSTFVFLFLPATPFKANLILLGLLAFIVFFAIGPGLVIWLVLSELLPTPIRSIGMGIGLSFNTLAATILSAAMLPVASTLGFGAIFLFSTICAMLYLIIVILKVPETKHQSLEAIEEHFKKA